MEAPPEATTGPQPEERREGGKRRRDGTSFTQGQSAESPDKKGRRAARATRRADDERPRSPRSLRSIVLPPVQPAGENGKAERDSDSRNGAALLNETTVLDLKGKGGAKTAARVQKRQQAAAVALDNLDHDAALGALNRHLNTVTQQITAAHRVIERVTAERDALRQQIADLKGVPVDEIVVTAVAAAPTSNPRAHPERARHEHGNGNGHEPLESPAPSLFQRLNFFGGEDFEQMRKRRQLFVLGLAVIGGILAVIAKQVGWSMPENISRDSLSALPVLGNLMSVFLAGWVMYRIVRVSSKGVRWVFPSEPRTRHRH
jgi:cell division protein FtsB